MREKVAFVSGADTCAPVFDYRGFGESGGEPRQVVDLPSQHEDIRAAVAWVRGRDDLDPDRGALWGNSWAGRMSSRSRPTTPGSSPWWPRFPSTASPGGSPHSLQT